MPKIAADSVQEHVARQEAAVIDAAIRLFNERGVRDVGLADIAKEVGLARNSLYRYFPDKAHILAAWFRTTIAPLVVESNEIAAADAPVADRLVRWVDAQFASLTDPDHAAMLMASNEMETLPDDVRAELGAGHRELYGSLATILRDAFADQPDRDAEVVTMLIAAVVRNAAEQVRSGADAATVRDELRRATVSMTGHTAS
jgi:AcrR family transcriptional regulator